VGGGLLGLEAARAVHGLGLDVTVVEGSPRLLSRQLDTAGSAVLRARIEDLGVRVRTSARTARVDAARGGLALRFAEGPEVEADLVIFAAGIRPRSELAAASGLLVAANGGVVVDDRLATSDDRIFAVGECASHRGMVYGLAAPGYRMVDVLVHNLAGGDARFTGAGLSARLKLLGVEVASLGRHDESETPGASAHVHEARGVYRKLVVADGQIVGAIAVGPWEDLGRVQEAIEEPRSFSFWDLRRFRGTGNLFLRSESPPVHLWPAEALVCGCLGVRRGAISAAEAAGCASVEAIGARTGAGTMCGSCRPLLADFLRGERVDSLPPAALATLAPPRMTPAEDTPPTLRSNPAGDGPEELDDDDEDGPESLRSPRVSSPARAPLDTLASASPASERYSVPVSIQVKGERALPERAALAPASPCVALPFVMNGGSAGAWGAQGAQRPQERGNPAVPPSSSTEPVPSSSVPSSAVATRPASSRRVRAPASARLEPIEPMPASSRRDSMRPPRPLSVPPERLPTLPSPRAEPDLREARLRRALLAAAAATLIGALAALVVPGLAPAPSFRGVHLDAILDAATARRVTGWVAAALSLAGLVLPLRKRVERAAIGDVAVHRAAHAVLGAGALGAVLLHTGLHLGVRLNLALMLDFLALSIVGALAGVAASRGLLAPADASRRVAVGRVHVALFLPLPVLVALHAVSAYRFGP
jgi:bacterioferritin-associated ferredoxin